MDDFFETHDFDDLNEWETEQVFQDDEGGLREEYGLEDDDCGYIDDMPIGG